MTKRLSGIIKRRNTSVVQEPFSIVDLLIMIWITFLCLTCVLPFFHLIARSLSSSRAVLSNEVFFWPKEVNIDAYIRVFTSSLMMRQMLFTAMLTVVQTTMALIVTSLAAYPLSKRYLPGRYPITIAIMITMYFTPGLIPTYLLYNDLGLLNNVWVLILPGVFSAYNMLIMRTYFMNAVPIELEESAIMDGAGHFRIYLQIWLPLSKPVIATIGLWVAVGRWNSFADSMWFTTNRYLQTLQLLLYNMILSARPSESFTGEALMGLAPSAPETLQAATIMFATVPILLVYPFVQKYFVKGVMLGSVKG